MSRRISLAIVVGWLSYAAPAAAQEFRFHGWNAAGEAVFDVRDPEHLLPWAGGYDELQAACAPAAIGDADWETGCRGCPPEGCEDTTPVKKPRSSLTSPDKKLTITDTRQCELVMPGQKACQRSIGFGKLGEVLYHEPNARRKPTLAVYFRPDSQVAVVVFTDQTFEGKRFHAVVAVALTAAAAPLPATLDRGAIVAGMRALTDDVRKCLSTGKHPATTVKLKVVIASDGTITAHEIVDAASVDPGIVTCIGQAVPRARFAPFRGAPMSVAYPLSL